MLKALSDETRMRIMRALLHRKMSVGSIAEELKLSQYNVSKHLRILKEAGLVASEKCGQQRLYSIESRLKSRIVKNRNSLELDCCTFRFDKFPE